MALEQTVPPASFARRLADRSPFFNAVRIAVRAVRWKYAGLRAWVLVIAGGIYHWFRGVTPKPSHEALVTLFAHDGGRACDLFARVVAGLHPPYALPPAAGVLGNLGAEELSRINDGLERDGYHVFPEAVSPDMCDSILRQTLELKLQVMGDEAVAEAARSGAAKYERFDRSAPKATQYNLTRDDTTDIAEVQQLISDPSIIAVAQNYLRSKPIFTGIYLGWSAAVKDTPDENAAQEFHWDMERIRWLRFFIYLTDVGPENGPHCFIRGTHRTGAISKDLLRQGYVRHHDEAVIQRYGRENYREFTGRRGTVIAEDSRGLHKGKMLSAGDRLLLAFELSNTTFGANKRHLIRNIHIPRLAEFAKAYPRIYSNLDFAKPL